MRTIIGLVERVTLIGATAQKTVSARIDTGASRSSIDRSLARSLGVGRAIKLRVVKSAHGSAVRPVVRVRVRVAGRRFLASFTVADRSHMKYRVLIGRNILRKGFLIDPMRT